MDGSTIGSTGLGASFERLCANADAWRPDRLVDEGLDLVRDSSWADRCALYSVRDGAVRLVAHRPASDADAATRPDPGWFPWGLAPVNPQRFVLVEDARRLPAAPEGSSTLGDQGVRSCLHLPILERTVPIGALHLLWHEPRLAWDDDRGRLLRTLGHFLLTRAAARRDSLAGDGGGAGQTSSGSGRV